MIIPAWFTPEWSLFKYVVPRYLLNLGLGRLSFLAAVALPLLCSSLCCSRVSRRLFVQPLPACALTALQAQVAVKLWSLLARGYGCDVVEATWHLLTRNLMLP